MEYQQLGKTGLRVSKIGFGGIPIQRISEAETVVLFDALQRAGINYLDTARGYTVSEQYIGAALQGRREQFVLSTKSMARTAEAMAADIEVSLKNFRTDWIDLYQVHNPSMEQLCQLLAPGGALEALERAKAAGKIRHLGLTAHSLAVAMRALELPFVETIMFPYNIVEKQGEELIAACREKKIGFIDMKPLAGGAIENGDLALRFIVQNPGVSVVIPGMYTEEEVRKNTASVLNKQPFSEKEKAELAEIREQLKGNFCRRCNYCAPCAVGISIPNVFLFSGYLERYGLSEWAKERYETLPVKASACIGCGACEKRCPYQLPIREMLKKAAKGFGK